MNNKKLIGMIILVLLLMIGGVIVLSYMENVNNLTLSNNNTKNSSSNNTNLTENNGLKNNSPINNTNTFVNNGKKDSVKKSTFLTKKEAIKIAKEFGVDPLFKLGKTAHYENGFWKIPIYDKKAGKNVGYMTVSDKTGGVVGSVSHTY